MAACGSGTGLPDRGVAGGVENSQDSDGVGKHPVISSVGKSPKLPLPYVALGEAVARGVGNYLTQDKLDLVEEFTASPGFCRSYQR
jgi:hypothetical protein